MNVCETVEPACNKLVQQMWDAECRTDGIAWLCRQKTEFNHTGCQVEWRCRGSRPALKWSQFSELQDWDGNNLNLLLTATKIAASTAFLAAHNQFIQTLNILFDERVKEYSYTLTGVVRYRTPYGGSNAQTKEWLSTEIKMDDAKVHEWLAEHLGLDGPLMVLCHPENSSRLVQEMRGFGFGDYERVLPCDGIPQGVLFVFPARALRVPCLLHAPGWEVEVSETSVIVATYRAIVFEHPELVVRVRQ